MAETELMKCFCGEQPKLKSETLYSGGGRYKGKDRSDSWKVKCICYRSETAYSENTSKEASDEARERVIAKWNAMMVDAFERASSDKLLWDLDHACSCKAYVELKCKALARIIRAVEAKENL